MDERHSRSRQRIYDSWHWYSISTVGTGGTLDKRGMLRTIWSMTRGFGGLVTSSCIIYPKSREGEELRGDLIKESIVLIQSSIPNMLAF